MKILRIAIIFLLAISISALSYAADMNVSSGNKAAVKAVKATDALQHRPGIKAERGVKNILFGWTDIPKSIIDVTRDSKNPLWGLTGGTLKGVGKAFPRTISGIADVVTFPFSPKDKPYEQPLVRPDELNTRIR